MFKDRIKEARKAAKMSQEQLGKILKVSKQTISDYERGYSEPDLAKVTLLMSTLNIDANYLWQDEMNNLDSSAEISDRAMEVAKAFDMMSDYGKAIICFVVRHEEQLQKESFGKAKILCAGTENFPSITSVTGFPVGHPASAQAWYNAMQEQKELKQEETPCDS